MRCVLPWYNRAGWLGVKHQLTYLTPTQFQWFNGNLNSINPSLNPFQSANGNSNNSNNNNNNNYSIVSEGRRTAPPPGISVEWNVEGLADNDPFVEELDPCAICCEELSSGPVQVLDCGHRYHDKVTALSVVFLRMLLKSLPWLLFFLGGCQNRYHDGLLFFLGGCQNRYHDCVLFFLGGCQNRYHSCLLFFLRRCQNHDHDCLLFFLRLLSKLLPWPGNSIICCFSLDCQNSNTIR